MKDRYEIDDTPESAEERECAKSAANEREIDRADYLRDEMKDRAMEEAIERDRLRDILRNSLPVAVEPAPPVPQRLADEIAANFMRSIPSARPPRFFRHSDNTKWEFRNGVMTVEHGDLSIFRNPAELLECLDVIEVDAEGNPREPTREDIAAERGDHEQKLRQEDEA